MVGRSSRVVGRPGCYLAFASDMDWGRDMLQQQMEQNEAKHVRLISAGEAMSKVAFLSNRNFDQDQETGVGSMTSPRRGRKCSPDCWHHNGGLIKKDSAIFSICGVRIVV